MEGSDHLSRPEGRVLKGSKEFLEERNPNANHLARLGPVSVSEPILKRTLQPYWYGWRFPTLALGRFMAFNVLYGTIEIEPGLLAGGK